MQRLIPFTILLLLLLSAAPRPAAAVCQCVCRAAAEGQSPIEQDLGSVRATPTENENEVCGDTCRSWIRDRNAREDPDVFFNSVACTPIAEPTQACRCAGGRSEEPQPDVESCCTACGAGAGAGVNFGGASVACPAPAEAAHTCECCTPASVSAADADSCKRECQPFGGVRAFDRRSLPDTPLCPDEGGAAKGSGPAIPRLSNPLGSASVPALIGKLIKTALGISGSLAFLMFIYGGIVYLTSAGTPERIEVGKKTLTWAAVGIVIIFAAYALVSFVIDALSGATT